MSISYLHTESISSASWLSYPACLIRLLTGLPMSGLSCACWFNHSLSFWACSIRRSRSLISASSKSFVKFSSRFRGDCFPASNFGFLAWILSPLTFKPWLNCSLKWTLLGFFSLSGPSRTRFHCPGYCSFFTCKGIFLRRIGRVAYFGIFRGDFGFWLLALVWSTFGFLGESTESWTSGATMLSLILTLGDSWLSNMILSAAERGEFNSIKFSKFILYL